MGSIANCAVGMRLSMVGMRTSLEMGDSGASCSSVARNT